MRLCIVQPQLKAVSETFIAAHAERLPAEVTVVHQGARGRAMIGPELVLSDSIVARASRKVWRIAERREWSERTESYREAFRRIRPEAVLAEYGITGVAVMDACRLSGLPLIVHFHGYDASQTKTLAAFQEDYVRMFDQAAAIVAVSHDMRTRLRGLGCPADKLVYNPYGVDCTRFQGAKPSANPPTFLAVGRFVEKKAPHLTLVGFANMLRSAPEARLRMIGDGPLLSVCRDLADSLGIGDSISFLGSQPSDVVRLEMSRARAFVQHSVEAADGDREGTPVAVLEAAASGLPVVATRHGGIVDAVIENQTGLLVDERDSSGMAKNMLRMIEEPEIADAMGAAGRDRVVTCFSMEKSINALWGIIRAAASGRARAASFDGGCSNSNSRTRPGDDLRTGSGGAVSVTPVIWNRP